MYVFTSLRTINDQTRCKNVLDILVLISYLLSIKFRSSFFIVVIITDVIIIRVLKCISKYFRHFFSTLFSRFDHFSSKKFKRLYKREMLCLANNFFARKKEEKIHKYITNLNIIIHKRMSSILAQRKNRN